MPVEVETRNIAGQVTALRSAGQFTLVVDRPAEAGGGGRGFNGGQLMYLSIAGCISNDLFREALQRGIKLDQIVVRVAGDFVGEPAISTEVSYEVELNGDADDEALRGLIEHVDRIAEIPNSLRSGTPMRLNRAAILQKSR